MYYYIYDECVQDQKYEKDLLRIENRLTDLGLSGDIARLALFKRADEFIREEIRRGVTTIVVVGNDETIYKILDVITETDLTFGIIPLGPDNHIARSLGIPEGALACDVLSARIVQTIDTGMLNGKRFLAGVRIPETTAEITCGDCYRVKPTTKGSIEINNFTVSKEQEHGQVFSDPQDGFLDTVIRVEYKQGKWFSKKKMGVTSLPLRSLMIRSREPVTAFADGKEVEGTRFEITIAPLSLKVITGKERMF